MRRPALLRARAAGVVAAVFAGHAAVALAQAVPGDFARGIEVKAPGPQPIARMTVPEGVYTTSTKPGLADVRVFDRTGRAVPHTLRRPVLPAAEASAAVGLPVFPLFERTGGNQRVAQVAIGPDGAVVRVQEVPAQGTARVAYVVDASAIDAPLAQATLDWSVPASETFFATVGVDGSNDLNTWQPLATAAIARLLSQNQELRQADIGLGNQRARYLRVSWPKSLANVRLTGVRVQPQSAVQAPPITWTSRSASSAGGTATAEFDSGGLIPVEHLDLELVDQTDAAVVTFSSRRDTDSPWRFVRQEVIYRMTQADRTIASAPLRVAPTTDRYWRVEVARDGGWGAGRLPRLKLGWYPDELLFLTQGGGPFTLAYGSVSAVASSAPIEVLLQGVAARSDEERLQTATHGTARDLGGQAALTEPKSLRRFGLWAALVVAVAALAALAFRLSREMGRGSLRG